MSRSPRVWHRRMVHALAAVIAVGFVICVGSAVSNPFQRPSPIHYVDRPGQSSFPLTIYGGYSASVPVLHHGDSYSTSIVLRSTGSETAQIIRAEPIARSKNLEVVGTSAAGPDRHFGQALGYRGYPPPLPAQARTRYRPVDEVPVAPDDPRNPHGVDMLIGVRFRTGHRAWFDGVRVTFRVGDRTFVGEFALAWAMCDSLPCDPPTIGLPWGPT